MGFREDLKIDKYSLDEEWINQPTLFLNWAEKVVEAQSQRDRAKESLDLIKAELDSDIRTSPSKYGLDKLTEGAIQNTIVQDGTYRDGNTKYLDAIKDTRTLEVAKEALEHRKKALESLTQLYLSGYYLSDGAKMKGDIKDFVSDSKSEKMEESLNKNERLKRRSK